MQHAAARRNLASALYFPFPFSHVTRYHTPLHMRAILASIFLTGALFALTGCESDMPPTQTNGVTNGVNKLERGISGQGTLTQPDRSDDPIIKEDTRTGN